MLKKRYSLIFALIFSIILLTVSSVYAIAWNETPKTFNINWGNFTSNINNPTVDLHYPTLKSFQWGEDNWWYVFTNYSADSWWGCPISPSNFITGYSSQAPVLRTYSDGWVLLTQTNFYTMAGGAWGGYYPIQYWGSKFCSLAPNTTNTTDKIWVMCAGIYSNWNPPASRYDCVNTTWVGWINATTHSTIANTNFSATSGHNQSLYQMSNFGWASSGGNHYEPFSVLYWDSASKNFVLWAGDTTDSLTHKSYANGTLNMIYVHDAVGWQDTSDIDEWDWSGHQTGGAFNYIIWAGYVDGTSYGRALYVNRYTWDWRKEGYGLDDNLKDTYQLYTNDLGIFDVSLAKKADDYTGWILFTTPLQHEGSGVYGQRKVLNLLYTDNQWRGINTVEVPDPYIYFDVKYDTQLSLIDFSFSPVRIPTDTIRIHSIVYSTSIPSSSWDYKFNITVSNGSSTTVYNDTVGYCVDGCSVAPTWRKLFVEVANPYPNQTVTVTVRHSGSGGYVFTSEWARLSHYYDWGSPVLSVNKKTNTFVVTYMARKTGSDNQEGSPCFQNNQNTCVYFEHYRLEELQPCDCTGWLPDANCFYNNTRRYTRICTPSLCQNETKWEYDPTCQGATCTPHYRCYNSTTLGYYNSTCQFGLLLNCTYGCNATGEPPHACFASPSCGFCQNIEMHQNPFPDCLCSCTNYCLSYVNLSQSCACSPYPVLNYSQLQINTSEWQKNPVTIFADITSGIFALIGNILVPLMIIFLAIGFASIIVIIFKKAVPSGV